MAPEPPRRYQARAFDARRRQHCPPDALYVGNACLGWPQTPWGNRHPWKVLGRDQAVWRFVADALSRAQRDPDWLAPLRGRSLICWCKPGERCHADFLLLLANRPPAEAWRAYIVQVGRQAIAAERGTLARLERMGDDDADR